jgi:hypothetical protein
MGRSAERTGEDHGHLVGSADADVVGHQRLEESSGPARVIKDQGAGSLDLAHRQFPPEPRGPVGVGERGGDTGDPAVEERLNVGGPEAVADGLEALGSGAGGEPVGQFGEADPSPAGLPFGPLMSVDPLRGGRDYGFTTSTLVALS